MDIEIIERQILDILSPKKAADTENASRFIKAYTNGKLYSTRQWRKFPLIKINLNPSIFSKIIVQYSDIYLEGEVKNKKEIPLKAFDDKAIRPPAKLLVYYIIKEPFNQELIDESIVYFRECSPEERKGAFSILYRILNPFEFT